MVMFDGKQAWRRIIGGLLEGPSEDALVPRFQSPQSVCAPSDADFGIKGALATSWF